ncbi:MAG TPA: chemotaxis protein CheW [Firmicutes bacterium]|nr:chemotaxis protein CheW [Bacillota bacterium]
MLFATEDQMAELLEEAPAETLTDKYLVFLTDGLRFGVEAEYVVEIINNYAITRLPIVPPYVRGIINLRGLIIPILDIRSRLGKAPAEDDCIVVLSQNETQLGILVDTVDRMVDVDRESISPMPAQNTQELISGMCSLAEGETLLILDCEKLFQA